MALDAVIWLGWKGQFSGEVGETCIIYNNWNRIFNFEIYKSINLKDKGLKKIKKIKIY